jgi:hypothetical protein
VGGKTAVAAMVVKGSSAVYKLLLAKVAELSILLDVVRLHGADGRESPAAATFSLCLNRRHDTIISPVPMRGDVSEDIFD